MKTAGRDRARPLHGAAITAGRYPGGAQCAPLRRRTKQTRNPPVWKTIRRGGTEPAPYPVRPSPRGDILGANSVRLYAAGRKGAKEPAAGAGKAAKQQNALIPRAETRASEIPSGKGRYTAKGTRLGFMASRQSRSPRAKPWISSSAVATLLAKGTECWSHRRIISSASALSSSSRG